MPASASPKKAPKRKGAMERTPSTELFVADLPRADCTSKRTMADSASASRTPLRIKRIFQRSHPVATRNGWLTKRRIRLVSWRPNTHGSSAGQTSGVPRRRGKKKSATPATNNPAHPNTWRWPCVCTIAAHQVPKGMPKNGESVRTVASAKPPPLPRSNAARR